MQKFILAYHQSPQIDSPEDSAKHLENWMAWSAGLGDAVVDPGMPVGMSKTVTPDGVEDNGGSNPLAGITIVQAETMDEAIDMAKSCPHVSLGGTIEVAPAIEMNQ